MFIPRATGSVRNPRRRQRTSSGESSKQPNAKRQRSVQKDTEVPSDIDQNENENQHEPSEILTSKSDTLPSKQLAIRGPKKFEKRRDVNDLDGAAILVCSSSLDSIDRFLMLTLNKSRTDFYTVSQLPALPDQLRGLQTGKFTRLILVLNW